MSDDTYKMYIKNFNIDLLNCKLLGKGHNGIVYLLPDGKVMKICFEEKSCRSEYYILKKVDGSKFFPKVYGMSGNYMIRDYVGGCTLKDYIKRRGLNRKMAMRIIELLDEFKRLKFTKLDIRCKDIFVQSDGSLKVIDPKKCYAKKRDFPQHLAKGLNKLGVLEYFLEVVKEERPDLYSNWNRRIKKYIGEKNYCRV